MDSKEILELAKSDKKIKDAISLFLWADKHNWDDGYSELNRILKWKTCCLATVSLIYWRSAPEYFRSYKSQKEVESVNRSGWRFVHKVEKILLSGKKPIILRFDPASERESYEDRKDTFVRELPAEVYNIIPGYIEAEDVRRYVVRDSFGKLSAKEA